MSSSSSLMISIPNNMSTLNIENRSISPLTPSPSRESKGLKLFRAISKKLARRSHEEIGICDTDSRSSSSESCNSSITTNSRASRGKKVQLSADSGFRSSSPNQSTTSSESENSDKNAKRSRHHHSTSAESIRKMFEHLNLNVRSRSCSGTSNKDSNVKRKSSGAPKKLPPKSILRQPVSYTYVKGLSGLPTQRVPRNQSYSYKVYNGCNCGMQYLGSLQR